MRKVALTLVAIFLSTMISSAALAYSSDHDYHNNKYFVYSSHDKYKKYYYGKNYTTIEKLLLKNKSMKKYRNWGYDRYLERYFYVDERGVSRYFYLNPHKDYNVYQYKDKNNVTQFWFEDNGRKI